MAHRIGAQGKYLVRSVDTETTIIYNYHEERAVLIEMGLSVDEG
jgi:hypothetical protein